MIVRYRKSGYLKRLNATPLSATEFLLAQVLSRLVLITLATVMVFIGTHLFMHFTMEGRYLDLLIVLVLGAFSLIALSLLVAARVSSEELAGGLLNLLTWPMMVLSGLVFDGRNQPGHARLKPAIPLTHMLAAARAIMLDGAGLADISVHLLVLAVMSVVFGGRGLYVQVDNRNFSPLRGKGWGWGGISGSVNLHRDVPTFQQGRVR